MSDPFVICLRLGRRHARRGPEVVFLPENGVPVAIRESQAVNAEVIGTDGRRTVCQLPAGALLDAVPLTLHEVAAVWGREE